MNATYPLPSAEWEKRNDELWAAIDEYEPEVFVALVDEHAAKVPKGTGIAAFERACSFDSTGHSDKAVPLYREALENGLTGIRRRRAVIQLASSLRNVGHPEESLRLLTAEMEAGSDELDDALRCVMALTLTALGREREAVSILLIAMADHLPRYQRSMKNYARLLVE
ncbi:tetratricopeptide repeat protein [Stackebrandtia nassauensis]|uniref:Tetratrico peptide repeat group 5 domain-containing protein n=1 Tax=Stackebrandtia nassauensis (strain DSM 44728 / CIP 108903 / NRRL B-16338 / NBRC 102104 / LLR-40K-21) TaxID=446470 RepID=D3Q9D1_STANL|nr:tetratricopeptide repeat protein [Stackebrandtia nassauensis]ADD42613.1 hypothetical protein Snas_2938 [Stackebrandtia nassauensis DSM 44728]